MATDLQSSDFIHEVYQNVWENYSTAGLEKYYSKQLIARSQGKTFDYEQFHALLLDNTDALSHMNTAFHHTIANGDNAVTTWFTTVHFDHAGNEAYRINTMSNYTIKNDVVTEIDFMWDRPIEEVFNRKTDTLGLLNKQFIPRLDGISKREAQCFFYLIQGHSAKQIARHLNISNRTVETHTNNIKKKLNLHSRQDITEYAYEQGLITMSPLLNSIIAPCQ